MKKLFFIQRLLAALIDLIIVYLPFLLLVQVIFTQTVASSFANLLAAVIFVLYNLIAESAFSGQTIGKYFAHLKVATASQGLMEIGQREAAKLLYFLPFAGWLFMGISLICYFVSDKFLHDLIGRSRVIIHG